jgi:hypothetical protein
MVKAVEQFDSYRGLYPAICGFDLWRHASRERAAAPGERDSNAALIVF